MWAILSTSSDDEFLTEEGISILLVIRPVNVSSFSVSCSVMVIRLYRMKLSWTQT